MRIIEQEGGHPGGRDESCPMPAGQRPVILVVGLRGQTSTGIGGGDADGSQEGNHSQSNDGWGRRLHRFVSMDELQYSGSNASNAE